MFDYMGFPDFDGFITIQAACEILGLTKDELKAKCEQYGVEARKVNGMWGFFSEVLRSFNNTLYYEQCRDGNDDTQTWADIHGVHSSKIKYRPTQVKSSKPNGKNPATRSYIKTIKDLKGTYTYDEACQLLGITPETLMRVYKQYDIPTFKNSRQAPVMTCYDFLTINNKLYNEQCVSPIVRDF